MARRRRPLVGLSLLALASVARGAAPPPVARPTPDVAPSAELLLFIAEFRDARGNEVDPIALAEAKERTAEEPAGPGDAKAKVQAKPIDDHERHADQPAPHR